MEGEEPYREDESNNEHWLNSFEEQCLENWGEESSLEDTMINERERATQKLWLGFQNTATSITQLYKDRYQGLSLWIPFQNAASAATTMYKESNDIMKKVSDSSYHHGRLTRNRDIVSWAKKKCRYIRRDELLAFVCGKSPPPPIRHRLQSSVTRQSVWLPSDRHSPRLNLNGDAACEEPDLQPFRDALILQGLNGAMSNVSVEYLPHNNASPRTGGDDGLNRFILDQLSRQNEARKRSASTDIINDSPNRKRSRLL